MAQRHVAAGVDIRCGIGVTGLARTDTGVMITLTSGETVECDTVVAGVGATPETALAEKAGLAVDNGVSSTRAAQLGSRHLRGRRLLLVPAPGL